MQRLGLSQTSNPSDVLKMAKQYFSDPWLVDSALFYLGAELGVTSIEGFVGFHKRMMAWKKLRPDIARRLLVVLKEIRKDLGDNHWEVDIESSFHWVGLYLVRTNGPLRDL
jgi:hypothetical protein